MKKSNIVFTALLSGGVLYSVLHHNPVYRDLYANREDCLKDWGSTPNACEPEPGNGSSGGYYGGYRGPTYEEGSRPGTAQNHKVQSRQLVTRGGFGSSGARFSGGG
ncbi:hypothetical protein NK553_10585 [Pseudomonas sp. ZM23]|uniref:Uncharacterized protein n=1 Tax=Pseudomonas triclosanedens TaxID=2961893 RepID=A0ABY7A3L8_9PSED|nr:hypothetical protein [Pseudomonas triclosanedens]MCP8464396.1 hypothetical protein [Pseudomonas triclosanedens]MCP8471530.1 hypothetical protein [Pseudomonas triclosanedens]MCP8477661.1 hypothetical protein [Pseudomonas triclosanedens]WAI51116.1 hypothetical protein OU419_07635 [Pseudomonas triclosanedens]